MSGSGWGPKLSHFWKERSIDCGKQQGKSARSIVNVLSRDAWNSDRDEAGEKRVVGRTHCRSSAFDRRGQPEHLLSRKGMKFPSVTPSDGPVQRSVVGNRAEFGDSIEKAAVDLGIVSVNLADTLKSSLPLKPSCLFLMIKQIDIGSVAPSP
jgi:hypothetical protein